jgi:hypothetical protein
MQGCARRYAALAALAAGALLALSPTAVAQEPTLAVVNLGSAGLQSVVPQPAVTLSSRGACATALTVQEANGGPSPCPEGAWPPLGQAVPGPPWDGSAWGIPWASTVQIAGGDELELRFDRPMDAVEASILTNFPVGLTDPNGAPVPNVAILSPGAAQSTADGAVWKLSLPALIDPRARSNSAFSIAASAGGEEHAFALAAMSPRFADFTQDCGAAYFNDSVSTGPAWSCPHLPKGGPPVVIPATQPAQPKPTAKLPIKIRSRRILVRCGRGRVGVKVPTRGLLGYRTFVAGVRTPLVQRRIVRAGWSVVSVRVPRGERSRLSPRRGVAARLEVSVRPNVGEPTTRRWRLLLFGRKASCRASRSHRAGPDS